MHLKTEKVRFELTIDDFGNRYFTVKLFFLCQFMFYLKEFKTRIAYTTVYTLLLFSILSTFGTTIYFLLISNIIFSSVNLKVESVNYLVFINPYEELVRSLDLAATLSLIPMLLFIINTTLEFFSAELTGKNYIKNLKTLFLVILSSLLYIWALFTIIFPGVLNFLSEDHFAQKSLNFITESNPTFYVNTFKTVCTITVFMVLILLTCVLKKKIFYCVLTLIFSQNSFILFAAWVTTLLIYVLIAITVKIKVKLIWHKIKRG